MNYYNIYINLYCELLCSHSRVSIIELPSLLVQHDHITCLVWTTSKKCIVTNHQGHYSHLSMLSSHSRVSIIELPSLLVRHDHITCLVWTTSKKYIVTNHQGHYSHLSMLSSHSRISILSCSVCWYDMTTLLAWFELLLRSVSWQTIRGIIVILAC